MEKERYTDNWYSNLIIGYVGVDIYNIIELQRIEIIPTPAVAVYNYPQVLDEAKGKSIIAHVVCSYV